MKYGTHNMDDNPSSKELRPERRPAWRWWIDDHLPVHTGDLPQWLDFWCGTDRVHKQDLQDEVLALFKYDLLELYRVGLEQSRRDVFADVVGVAIHYARRLDYARTLHAQAPRLVLIEGGLNDRQIAAVAHANGTYSEVLPRMTEIVSLKQHLEILDGFMHIQDV